MANLIDLYGAERAVFLVAYAALATADRVEQGLIDGISFDDKAVSRLTKMVANGLKAGQELPTDKEFEMAISAVAVRYPSITATSRGKAFAAFKRVQEGAGQG